MEPAPSQCTFDTDCITKQGLASSCEEHACQYALPRNPTDPGECQFNHDCPLSRHHCVNAQCVQDAPNPTEDPLNPLFYTTPAYNYVICTLQQTKEKEGPVAGTLPEMVKACQSCMDGYAGIDIKKYDACSFHQLAYIRTASSTGVASAGMDWFCHAYPSLCTTMRRLPPDALLPGNDEFRRLVIAEELAAAGL